MAREMKELHRKGESLMMSWRKSLLGLVFLLPVALVLSGCPKKPEVQTAAPAAVAPAPAPVPAPQPTEETVVVEEKEEVVVEQTQEILLQDVFFDFDKSGLRADARQALDENIQALNDNSQARIVVEGHCDDRGTVEYNLALGQRRARAVRDYLVARGIDSDRISTISYGEERPFCLGQDESAWQCNRRGHFVVVE